MDYRFKTTQNGKTTSDTMISIDEIDGTITLSDCDNGPAVESYFGDSDIEWFYKFTIEDFLKLQEFLKKEYQPKAIEEFSIEERKLYNSITNSELKEIIAILFSYMKLNNGYSLALLAEEKKINVISYSF